MNVLKCVAALSVFARFDSICFEIVKELSAITVYSVQLHIFIVKHLNQIGSHPLCSKV